MIKLALVGSGGFILSNFIRYLLFNKNIYSIVSIDRYDDERQLNNIYINKGNKFYVADITDSFILNRIFQIEQPDVVIHGAVSDDLCSNVRGIYNLIKCVKEQNIGRIIYLSTYEREIKDQYVLNKIMSEELLKMSDVNYTIVKLCDVIGPRQQPYSRNAFVPKIIKNIMMDEKTVVDDTIREWLHVTDVCGVLSNVLENNIKEVSCSYGYAFSVCELYTEVSSVLNKGGDLMKYIGGTSKQYIAEKMDDSLKHKNTPLKFKEAVRMATQWYLDNAWFLRDCT